MTRGIASVQTEAGKRRRVYVTNDGKAVRWHRPKNSTHRNPTKDEYNNTIKPWAKAQGYTAPRWKATPKPPLQLVSRRTWRARPATKTDRRDWTPGIDVHIHHTVSYPAANTPASERAYMRAIQAQHQSQGWRDIGYHAVIMPSGRAYVGAGREVHGVHSATVNHQPGISFAGNYQERKPTAAQLKTLRQLRAHWNIDKGRLRPHAATYATACPGKHLREALGI